MTRPRLLFVTPRFPYPLIGGGPLRTFNLVTQLSKKFDVTLLSLYSAAKPIQMDAVLPTGIRELICIPHSPVGAAFSVLRALPRHAPLNVEFYRSSALQRQVDRLVPQHHASIFHTIRVSGTWQEQGSGPAILDMCDAIGFNSAQTAGHGGFLSPWRRLSAIDAPRTVDFERREIARFALTTIHTEADAERVGIPEGKLLVSTQGVNFSRMNFLSPEGRRGRSIAMIGKMDFFPNWHGALWFIENVLPRLPADIHFKIIGFCPPKRRAILEKYPRVIVTGQVASLDEASADCFCAVAPMRVATGIQNKVLEYFSMGLPAMVSPAVSQGLLAQAEGSYFKADGSEDWANSIMTCAGNLDLASDMARRARLYVEQCHDWDRIGAEYVERLDSLLGT
jgi:glycosyltransferase involved in cell wall biosynthesis